MVTRAARLSWPIARRKPGRLRPSCIHARPSAPTRYASATSLLPAVARSSLARYHANDFGSVTSSRPHRLSSPSTCRTGRRAGAVSPRSPVCRNGSTPWMKVDSSIARAPWPCHSGGSSPASWPSAASASSRAFCSTSFCTAPFSTTLSGSAICGRRWRGGASSTVSSPVPASSNRVSCAGKVTPSPAPPSARWLAGSGNRSAWSLCMGVPVGSIDGMSTEVLAGNGERVAKLRCRFRECDGARSRATPCVDATRHQCRPAAGPSPPSRPAAGTTGPLRSSAVACETSRLPSASSTSRCG